MTELRERLEEHRDQALRDIVDLERQVADGEIPGGVAEGLRHRYEARAAAALRALDELPGLEVGQGGTGRPRSRSVLALYAVAAAVAVFAAVVLLPRFVAARPDAGFVSGNEAIQAPAAAAPPAASDAPGLAGLTDAELEAMVAADPQLVGPRLVLAERYVQQGRYDDAARLLQQLSAHSYLDPALRDQVTAALQTAREREAGGAR